MTGIRRLGLVLVIVFALGAYAADAAPATHFKATKYPARIKAEGTNGKFKIGSGVEVSCEKTIFTNIENLSAESETLLMSPKYEGCSAFGFEGAKVEAGTCNYRFHTNGMADIIKSATEKECGPIKISDSLTTCEVQIGGQEKREKVTYTNEAGKVKVKAAIKKIEYKISKTGTGCPSKTGEEAIYEETATASATNPSEPKEKINIEVA